MDVTLPCARCGYDLRATPREGVCPECETPVEKAIELAAIPLRPLWRDSDPRWRRRMLAGAWVLVFVPLIAVLEQFGLAERISLPVPYDFVRMLKTLDHSYVVVTYVYLVTCIGLVLVFGKERNRRPYQGDWTRRWGIFGSAILLLLAVPMYVTLPALVGLGVVASFLSLPAAEQPAITGLLTELSTGFFFYGPVLNNQVYIVAPIVSGCVILLACVPIHNALRSTGLRAGWAGWAGWAMVIPLALTALWQIVAAGRYHFYPPLSARTPPPSFFEPGALTWGLGAPGAIFENSRYRLDFVQEAIKWLTFLALAL